MRPATPGPGHEQAVEERENLDYNVVEAGLLKILDFRCVKFEAEDLVFIDAYLSGWL